MTPKCSSCGSPRLHLQQYQESIQGSTLRVPSPQQIQDTQILRDRHLGQERRIPQRHLETEKEIQGIPRTCKHGLSLNPHPGGHLLGGPSPVVLRRSGSSTRISQLSRYCPWIWCCLDLVVLGITQDHLNSDQGAHSNTRENTKCPGQSLNTNLNPRSGSVTHSFKVESQIPKQAKTHQ